MYDNLKKNSNPADILDGGGDEKQNFFFNGLNSNLNAPDKDIDGYHLNIKWFTAGQGNNLRLRAHTDHSTTDAIIFIRTQTSIK